MRVHRLTTLSTLAAFGLGLGVLVACSDTQMTGTADQRKEGDKKGGDKGGGSCLVEDCEGGEDGPRGSRGGIDAGDGEGYDDAGGNLEMEPGETTGGRGGRGGIDSEGDTDEGRLGQDEGDAANKPGDAGLDFDEAETALKFATATTGIAFDGKASICLDWKGGKITVTKLYPKYFMINATYELTKAGGAKETVRITNEGTFPLPGKWGDKVCGATASLASFTAKTAGSRKNQPIITTQNQGTQACFFVDDAEGDRGGSVIMNGVDWNIQKC